MFISLSVGGEKTAIGRGSVTSVIGIGSIVMMKEAIITILDAMNLVIGVPQYIALLSQSITETDISIPIVAVCQEGGDRFTKNIYVLMCYVYQALISLYSYDYSFKIHLPETFPIETDLKLSVKFKRDQILVS